MATNSSAGARYAHIVGWGMAVPERILTNNDLEAIVDTSDAWIQERTGIRERRIAAETDSTASLGFDAARQALDVANILPTTIDLIIVATSTPENIFPSTASLIQDALGAANAGAFDLSAACTGFIYAMNMAAQAILSGSIDIALIIGAETMSRMLDWEDRSTCIIFGDGAGAVIMRNSPIPGGILSNVLRSDGSGRDLLSVTTVGSIGLRKLKNGTGAAPGMHKLQMNGREVFRFATRVIKDSVLEALEKAELSVSDVDWVVPHQANQRIIDRAARTLDIPPEKFITNLDRYGNTSAASIPIALAEAAEHGVFKPDDQIVLVGFGGGLTWGAMVLTWGVTPPAEPTRVDRYRREMLYIFARQRSSLARTLRRMTRFMENTPLRMVYRRIDRMARKLEKNIEAMKKQRPSD